MSLSTEEANELLPDKPTKAISDPARLKYLGIGQPKWGKTTWFCDIPDSILLAFEEGHAFHETHKIIIDSWDRPYSEKKNGWLVDDDGNRHTSLVEAVEAIIASDKFNFVTIDTADMAAKMCLDYHYQKLGVTHAQDAGDYGKGWDVTLTQPFRRQIGQLMKAGRGLGFITHSQVITKKVGKSEVSRHETTLPSQVQKFLHTQADIILHCKFGKHYKDQPERDRVIILDGSDEILAGSRVRGIKMPRRFIVDPEHPWKQWEGFFKDAKNVDRATAYYEARMRGKDVDDLEDVPTVSEPAPEPEATEADDGGKRVKGAAQRRAAKVATLQDSKHKNK